MRVTFRKEFYTDVEGTYERHLLYVDDIEKMNQIECMAPEDNRFHRELASPHECEDVIKLAIFATKIGEQVTFCHEQVNYG